MRLPVLPADARAPRPSAPRLADQVDMRVLVGYDVHNHLFGGHGRASLAGHEDGTT